MKFTTKLSLVAASLAVVASASALADNAQHRNLLQIERAERANDARMTTVAAYTNHQGVGYGHGYASQERSEVRFEARMNAHGDTFYVAAPVR